MVTGYCVASPFDGEKGADIHGDLRFALWYWSLGLLVRRLILSELAWSVFSVGQLR